MIEVRLAKQDDKNFLSRHHQLSLERMLCKIIGGEVVVLIVNGVLAGQLRWDLLWSQIPYIELIFIEEQYRNQGLSRNLLGFLEGYLKQRGFTALLSSSQVDEADPQAWHRRMGFVECGMINGLNDGGIGEVFFKKDL